MEQQTPDSMKWPTHCPVCGTPFEHATIDFDVSNVAEPELRAGEMAVVDFCPNPDCPAKTTDSAESNSP